MLVAAASLGRRPRVRRSVEREAKGFELGLTTGSRIESGNAGSDARGRAGYGDAVRTVAAAIFDRVTHVVERGPLLVTRRKGGLQHFFDVRGAARLVYVRFMRSR